MLLNLCDYEVTNIINALQFAINAEEKLHCKWEPQHDLYLLSFY
jgi:hypothetical protein